MERDTSRDYSAEAQESLLVPSALLDAIAFIVHPSNHLQFQNFLALEGRNKLATSFLKKNITQRRLYQRIHGRKC